MGYRPERGGDAAPQRPFQRGRFSRYVAIAGLLLLVGVLAWLLIAKPHIAGGLRPGRQVPPFALPLAIGHVEGDPDIALHPDEGERGRVPACRERGSGILNICELYEKNPVVLALFIDEGGCEHVLKQLQSAAQRFPMVRFAAVAIKGGHAEVRQLVRKRRLSFPVGFDRHGVLASLYGMVSCPQLSFIYPGGKAQSRSLPQQPTAAVLAARVQALIAASEAQGWRRG